eukprot:TRINITY_DN16140_c0_g1_i1.p1 TRINITY_DN16140_c0_g1~~TRINITY_DN16140_c0_g1_i1.p1  ORF type:complete len:226 (+),score=38.77 TRINITY_DN16140_c0_g1_i1:77-754(+)
MAAGAAAHRVLSTSLQTGALARFPFALRAESAGLQRPVAARQQQFAPPYAPLVVGAWGFSDASILPAPAPQYQPPTKTWPPVSNPEAKPLSEFVLPGHSDESTSPVEAPNFSSAPLVAGLPSPPAEISEPVDGARTQPMECLKYAPRRRKAQGLLERWWLEYDPQKNNYISGAGRGPHGGNSIIKADWDRMMIPIHYKKKLERRERTRYAFRKNGVPLDIPKWGG